MTKPTSVEFCAGAGGQALGLEQAGFDHVLLVDNDRDCVTTLRHNRPDWEIRCEDMATASLVDAPSPDLFAAGLPCPPFSVAGKQLGTADERNLFPAALRLIEESQPKFVLIENVRGFLSRSFGDYREEIRSHLSALGYITDWRLLNTRDFGVPQSRTRVAIVAAKKAYWPHFSFPEPTHLTQTPVGDLLFDLMSENGWPGAGAWRTAAQGTAPTIVGGSKKHGGPDLGPTRARDAWRKLGVNGGSIAETAPMPDHEGMPRLTTRMVARVQGFPDQWEFTGRKTAAYRQVGNAFPPPVAKALGLAIKAAIVACENTESTPMAAE